MKGSKLNLITASLLSCSLLLSTNVLAGHHKENRVKPTHEMIKVKAEQGQDIKVMVVTKGDKNKYTFTTDELTNTDNVKAKLGDLDSETQGKVLQILSTLEQHDANMVVVKQLDIERGDKQSNVHLVKTKNENGTMHIEIDVDGDAVIDEKRFTNGFMFDGKQGKKMFKKRMKWLAEHGDTDKIVKVIHKLIKKADLNDEQIESLNQLLEQKRAQ